MSNEGAAAAFIATCLLKSDTTLISTFCDLHKKVVNFKYNRLPINFLCFILIKACFQRSDRGALGVALGVNQYLHLAAIRHLQ